MKLKFLFALMILFSGEVGAQAPSIQWARCYGGTARDEAHSVLQTSDGGFIVVGTSFSLDGDVIGVHGTYELSDIWMLKLDSLGNIQWQKCYGGSLDEWGYMVMQTIDNGFIICGRASSDDGDNSTNFNYHDDYWG